MRATLNSKPSMKFSSQLSRFSFCGKMLSQSVFFSVSAIAFSVFLWNALFFLYSLYAESIVTAWGSDPPLVLLLLLLLLKRTGVRKWRHYFILLANILLSRAVFGIYFTYFRTGIAGQQNGGFSGLFYVFLLRSSQVRISVGSVVFKSENCKRVKKSSKKRRAILNVNSWIIIICFCINGYCNWMLYIHP